MESPDAFVCQRCARERERETDGRKRQGFAQSGGKIAFLCFGSRGFLFILRGPVTRRSAGRHGVDVPRGMGSMVCGRGFRDFFLFGLLGGRV